MARTRGKKAATKAKAGGRTKSGRGAKASASKS